MPPHVCSQLGIPLCMSSHRQRLLGGLPLVLPGRSHYSSGAPPSCSLGPVASPPVPLGWPSRGEKLKGLNRFEELWALAFLSLLLGRCSLFQLRGRSWGQRGLRWAGDGSSGHSEQGRVSLAQRVEGLQASPPLPHLLRLPAHSSPPSGPRPASTPPSPPRVPGLLSLDCSVGWGPQTTHSTKASKARKRRLMSSGE